MMEGTAVLCCLPTTLDNMNKEQMKAAARLLLLMQNDPEAQANAAYYGDWFQHLLDHTSEQTVEQLELSPKALHPALR